MIEFAVVAPAITVLGTVLLQMGLVFHAKNLVNHATHLAARSGTMAHARLADIRLGLARGLVPLYGGGRDAASLAASLAPGGPIISRCTTGMMCGSFMQTP